MKKEFQVAGHCFSIEMDSSSPVWSRLTNYEPFMITDGVDCGPVFSLFAEPGPLPGKDDSFKPMYCGYAGPEEPKIDLFYDEREWLALMAPFGKMDYVAALKMNLDFSCGKLVFCEDKYGRYAVDNAAMLMYAFSTACLQTIEMHASVVTKGGKAYMFLAKSGTGKSTHSRMWLENLEGVELLNDDNPVVRLFDDGSIKVFGTPWSGKTPCYRNVSADLGAMVLIRRCPENKITPLSQFEAYSVVNSSTSGFRPVESMADGLYETVSAVVLTNTCYVLDCRPDSEAALVCSNCVCR